MVNMDVTVIQIKQEKKSWVEIVFNNQSIPVNLSIYNTRFEITGGPCNLIGSNLCDLFTNRTIFCFKSHLFPSQRGGYTKNKTNQI